MRGITLVALGNSYYGRMAYQLAVSLRIYSPGLQIALIYNDTAIREIELSMFDHLIPAPEEAHTFKTKQDAWIKAKLYLYDLSPFDETIFIDADMVAIGNFNQVFDQLKEFDFTMQNSGSVDLVNDMREEKYTWGSLFEIQLMYKFSSGLFYNLQSEFIYFKKKKSVKKLFDEAKKIFNNPKVNYRTFAGSVPDELAFSIAMVKTGIYPHQDKYKPIYWETAQQKKLYRFRTELFEKYYGFSLGGNIVSEYVRECYFDIMNACWRRMGLHGKPMVSNKNKIVSGREHA